MCHPQGGGVLTSIIKVYTDVRLDGVYFSGLQVYEWVSFSLQKYINRVSFSSKIYMNGKNLKNSIFSLWEVYEWVCFF